MDLPPLSYFLLLLLTAAAAPLLAAWAPRRRALVGLTLAGLALVWLGLALLHYGRWLCWPLAALGMALLGVAGTRKAWGAALALPALASGILFQAQAGIPGFATYFGVGLPLSLLVALGAVALRLSRDAPPGRALAGSALLLAAAAFVPLSAFGFGFLHGFELAHAVWLVAAVAGVAMLAGPAPRPPILESPADYEGRAGGDARLAAAALVAGAAFLALLPLLPTEAVGVRPFAAALLALAGLAAALLGALGTRGLAGWLAARERERFAASFAGSLDGRPAWPASALVLEGEPTVANLQGLAQELQPSRAPLAILVADRPLPEAALTWLAAQQGPRLIHAAVREGPETFVVPPVTPEEAP